MEEETNGGGANQCKHRNTAFILRSSVTAAVGLKTIDKNAKKTAAGAEQKIKFLTALRTQTTHAVGKKYR